MIEIITKDGISLDIDPESEFEIEIENPMFTDDHIPVPFSTSISFLPTKANNTVFGYLGAMMLEPSVRNVDVTIFSGGFPLMTGILIYDGVEDGLLNYSFSGTDLSGILNKYIHEASGLTKAMGTTVSGQQVEGPVLTIIKKIMEEGGDYDFGLPLIVCKQHVMKNDSPNSNLYPNYNEIDANVKFRNNDQIKNGFLTPTAPAVRIKSILSDMLPGLRAEDSLERLYESLAVVGIFLAEESVMGWQEVSPGTLHLDVAATLPEYKTIDLLADTLKILCASVFIDGSSGYVIMSHSGLIGSKEIDVWDEKIADGFSISTEERMSYVFGYDEYENDEFNPEPGERIAGYLGLRTIVNSTSSYGASLIRDIQTKDVFTVDRKRCLADIVYQDMGDVLPAGGDDVHSYDAKVGLRLVKCVPVNKRFAYHDTIGPNDEDYIRLGSNYYVCPRIDFPSMSLERPKEVYVGLLVHNQLTDKGQIPFGSDIYEDDLEYWPGHETDYDWPNLSTGMSLVPGDLLAGPHKTFAEWIGKDRQLITADLNLSNADISTFRIWKKVMIRQRQFFVKKLTITLRASSDHVDCRGEFVAV